MDTDLRFTFQRVDHRDEAMMRKLYHLRFEVYCRECGFIDAADYPDELESDGHDPQSAHFAAIDRDGEVIGTMRMICPGELPFPIERHCAHVRMHRDAPPSMQFAEISRLVISKKLRRRKEDAMYYEPRVDDQKVRDDENREFMRRARPMAFGLYREVYRASKQIGITHWYSLMEKSLWLLLRLHGFRFECIGEEVDVMGPVNPYLGTISEIEENVYQKFPKFYDYFSDGLDKQYQRDFSVRKSSGAYQDVGPES